MTRRDPDNLHFRVSPRLYLPMGISLWIVSPERETKLLQNVMAIRPSEPEKHSEASYPTFHPHITLATFPSERIHSSNSQADSNPIPGTSVPSGLDNIKAALSSVLIAPSSPNVETRDGSLPPLDIQFQSVSISDHYFRSVLIKIRLSRQLQALHALVHKALQIEHRTPMFPHLSLVYITDEDEADHKERELYLAELVKRGRVKGRVEDGQKTEFVGGRIAGEDGVSVNGADEDGQEEWIGSFDTKEIWLVDCDGPCESWKAVAKFHLP